jgi:hypothetical protein
MPTCSDGSPIGIRRLNAEEQVRLALASDARHAALAFRGAIVPAGRLLDTLTSFSGFAAPCLRDSKPEKSAARSLSQIAARYGRTV